MVSSLLPTAASRAGGVSASSAWHEVFSMSAALTLASWSTAKLARWLSVGRSLASISSAGHFSAETCATSQPRSRQHARLTKRDQLTRARGSMFTHFTPADLVAILNYCRDE